MEKNLFETIITQGAFAGLFVWMLFDTKKDSKEREVKYQETINMLADKVGDVKEIKEDVKEIKAKLNS